MTSRSRTATALLAMTDVARVERTITEAGARAKVQTTGLADDEVDVWQPYGFVSAPLEGADALRVAVGGRREGLIAIMVADRRYTIALEAGEVALVDDLGQKVHLTRDGIVVDAPSIKLGSAATKAVALHGDGVTVTGLWDTWLKAVGTATAAGPPPSWSMGTVAASATKAKAE
jgi:phage gp45-like